MQHSVSIRRPLLVSGRYVLVNIIIDMSFAYGLTTRPRANTIIDTGPRVWAGLCVGRHGNVICILGPIPQQREYVHRRSYGHELSLITNSITAVVEYYHVDRCERSDIGCEV